MLDMIREIEIKGCVEVPQDITEDDFCDKFIKFIEANDWQFGGGFRTIEDGYYMNNDGTRGRYVLDEK